MTLASRASICRGTQTWRIVHGHYGLGETVVNSVLAEVATELDVAEEVVENGNCESYRDVPLLYYFTPERYKKGIAARGEGTKNITRPDMYHKDQSIFSFTRSDGMFSILERWRCPTDGSSKACIRPDMYLCRDDKRTWVTPPKDASWKGEEIRVTKKSKLKAEGKKRIPKKPKEITSTGIGVVPGIENQVFQRWESKRIKLEEGDQDQSTDESDEEFKIFISRANKAKNSTSALRTRSAQPKEHDTKDTSSDLQTYHIIHPLQLALNFLSEGSVWTKKKRKRWKKKKIDGTILCCHIARYLECIEVINSDGRKAFTASIKWVTPLTLPSYYFRLSSVGLRGDFNGFAGYESPATAKLAIYLRALTEVACKWEPPDEDPRWTKKALPHWRRNVPGQDFCLLYYTDQARGQEHPKSFLLVY